MMTSCYASCLSGWGGGFTGGVKDNDQNGRGRAEEEYTRVSPEEGEVEGSRVDVGGVWMTSALNKVVF